MTVELLGEVVAWDVTAKEVPAQLVRDGISIAGINTDLPELRIATAFGRATKGLKKERLIRRRKEDKKSPAKRFQVNKVDETGGTINYDYDCTLQVDTETGKVDCTEDYELAKQVEQDVQAELETRTASDITRIVKQLFERHADLFPLVPCKGVAYFVPQSHAEFVAKVDTFLRHVGGKLCRMPVPKGTEEGTQSVRDAVKAGLDEMVSELNQSVELWEPGSTRKSTTAKALERWEQIRYKVDAYAEFLDAERSKLGESLEAAKAILANKITEVTVDDTEPQDADGATQDAKPAVDTKTRKQLISEGWDAYEAGDNIAQNPHVGTPAAKHWDEGWRAARDATVEESQAA
jgi:hypothetical protein